MILIKYVKFNLNLLIGVKQLKVKITASPCCYVWSKTFQYFKRNPVAHGWKPCGLGRALRKHLNSWKGTETLHKTKKKDLARCNAEGHVSG